MTRTIKYGSPIQKQPRSHSARHSPDDRRHAHPTGQPGMNAARKVEKHHHKR